MKHTPDLTAHKVQRYANFGNHLYVHIPAVGSKARLRWLYRGIRDGQRTWLAIGFYDALTEDEARVRVAELERQKMLGERMDTIKFKDVPLKVIAEKWFANKRPQWSANTEKTVYGRYQKHVLPVLGDTNIRDIRPRDIVALTDKIGKLGKANTAHLVVRELSSIFKFAMAQELVSSDPTYCIGAALPARSQVQHRPAPIEPKEIRRVMRGIASYPELLVRSALLTCAFTFCRPGEVRQAKWENIDLDEAEWHIPLGDMKMRRPHIVPLSTQVVEILKNLRDVSGKYKFVFPNYYNLAGDRAMSPNAMSYALRSLGFEREFITPHGFRSMASTILNENGFHADVIEKQLAHVQSNVRAVYNHASWLPDRKKMMQWWGDWLENIMRD